MPSGDGAAVAHGVTFDAGELGTGLYLLRGIPLCVHVIQSIMSPPVSGLFYDRFISRSRYELTPSPGNLLAALGQMLGLGAAGLPSFLIQCTEKGAISVFS